MPFGRHSCHRYEGPKTARLRGFRVHCFSLSPAAFPSPAIESGSSGTPAVLLRMPNKTRPYCDVPVRHTRYQHFETGLDGTVPQLAQRPIL